MNSLQETENPVEEKKFDYSYEVYRLLVEDKRFPFNKTNSFCILEKIEPETQHDLSLVKFDYKTVYKYEDDPSESVVGFFHTHPRGADYQSQTDVDTMNMWVECLGRSLFCVIDSGNAISGWLHVPGEEKGIPVKLIDYNNPDQLAKPGNERIVAYYPH